jgi:hypothetical protein
MYDVDIFSEDQKKFLASIVSDLDGTTSTGSILHVLQAVIYELVPDFDLSKLSAAPELKEDLEVCLAALNYLKVKETAESV